MINCTFEDNRSGKLRHVTVTAIAEKDEKILLVLRAAHLVQGGKYGLPGGFLDRDESLMQGIQREVLEETGYACEVKEMFVINDDPYRAREDRQNVDITFLVTVQEKVQEPDNEVTEVKWFALDALPDPTEVAFDHYLIMQNYKRYKKERSVLPLLGLQE